MAWNPFTPTDTFCAPPTGLLISSGLVTLGMFFYIVARVDPLALVFFFLVLPTLFVVVTVLNAALSFPVYAILRHFRALSFGAFLLGTAAVYMTVSSGLVIAGMPSRTSEKALWFATAYGTTFLPMSVLFWFFSTPGDRLTRSTGDRGPTASTQEPWDAYGPNRDVWDRNRV